MFCYLSFFTSLFIVLYYITFIFGTVFNFANNPFYSRPEPEDQPKSGASRGTCSNMESRTGDR